MTCSVGVNQEDHEALLAEVRRLEAELGRVRADLQGVLGCKGKCGQLDTLHDTVSRPHQDPDGRDGSDGRDGRDEMGEVGGMGEGV